MELPDDVKELLNKLRMRGFTPVLVAIEKTPESYHVWRYEGKRYVGELSSDEVYKEKGNSVVCGKLTCVCFLGQVIRYVWSRRDRELHEPEEW